MLLLRCSDSFLLCLLACRALCANGFRTALSSSINGEGGQKEQPARFTAETLAPATSTPLEVEAETKWEQELASVRDATRHGINPYGSKAWRAVHRVSIGTECQDAGVQIVAGGSTMVSVHTKSPKSCCAFCAQTEGCVAWSWNKDAVDANCHAQHACLRRIPKSNMVSGMKASVDGLWYYKVLPHLNNYSTFSFDAPLWFDWFAIAVDKTGEMNFENSYREHGKLKMVDSSAKGGHAGSARRVLFADDGLSWNEELEAKLEGTSQTEAGIVRVRLIDDKIQFKTWQADEGIFMEFIAERKHGAFQPYNRVTVKQDQVIAASDVIWMPANSTQDQPSIILKKGDGGTVDSVCHPRKTGVIFDQYPGKVVWLNDTLLVKSALLKNMSEEEVRLVLGDLGDVVIHAMQDPITLDFFKDPVMASDGFAYERSAMEQLIMRAEDYNEPPKSPMTREPLSSVRLSSNHTVRSLVSSVIDKIDVARAGAKKIQKRFRGYRLRKAVLRSGNVPVTWREASSVVGQTTRSSRDA